MKTLGRMTSTALRAAMVIGLGVSTLPAQAAYIMDLTQEGSNVVGTGRGSIDLTDLTLISSGGVGNLAVINPYSGGYSLPRRRVPPSIFTPASLAQRVLGPGA